MQANLGLQGVLVRIPGRWPKWFTAGKTTPRIHIERVARGRHPMGHVLGPENSRCGTCRFEYVRVNKSKYHKCEKVTETFGLATDVRLKWRGCALWEKKQ